MLYLILFPFVCCIIICFCDLSLPFRKLGIVNFGEKKQSKNGLVGTFTWRIENFSRLDQSKQLYSSTFEINKSRWRLILYPKTINVGGYFSVFLQVPDSTSLPYGWSRTVKCSIAVINQLDSKKTIKKEFEQQFTARQRDCGCYSYFRISELHGKSGGYLLKDTCVIEAQISVLAEKEGNVNVLEMKRAKNDLMGRFTWTIGNFTSFEESKVIYSNTFAINGSRWRLMLYPRDNNCKFLSAYIEVPDSANLPDGWSRTAAFGIALINQLDSKKTIKREVTEARKFTAKQSVWGWDSLLPLTELHSKSGGYLVKDTCLIEAHVTIVEDTPLDDAVESVYIKAKSFLKSIPKKSCSPISDATCEIPFFKDHGILAKECLNNLISIPLNDLANPKHETAMISALSILCDNLSLFSDEQAKEIMNLKATFPKIIQDYRELIKVKFSNQHVSSTFEKTNNLLEDLVETGEGIKTQLEELNEREKELEEQLKVVRSKSGQLKKERKEVSKQTKQVYTLAEEQFRSREIEEKKPEVNLASKKLEDMEYKWASIKALFT